MKNLRPWGNHRPPRKWQVQAARKIQASFKKGDFLAVATPGSGKTDLALGTGQEFLTDGLIDRIVVVVPTERLKRQWAEAAARRGIDLDPTLSNGQGCEAADYFGCCVTYAQVASAALLQDANCLNARTFVIIDEIHHAAANLHWGNQLEQGFKNATFRLALSGTPFRSDANQIPFVRYIDGTSQADFTYSYGQALADGVCRPVYFPTIEGNASWISGNGQVISCSLLDNVSRQVSGERLRAVLDPSGDWMKTVLREADNNLSQMRLNGHPDAGGLVIAMHQRHAEEIAKLLAVITNEQPVLAITDEENSSKLIGEFAVPGNLRRWIVAVKMISEGVDIPRLRVGVYASNVKSELAFRQAAGRFVRIIPQLDEQSAAFYMPADQTLIKHALSIKEERDHYLPEHTPVPKAVNSRAQTSISTSNNQGGGNNVVSGNANDGDNPDGDTNGSGDEIDENDPNGSQASSPNPNMGLGEGGREGSGIGTRNFIISLSSEARPHDTLFDGSTFSAAELKFAEDLGRQLGSKYPPAQFAAILRETPGFGSVAGGINTDPSPSSSAPCPTFSGVPPVPTPVVSGYQPQPVMSIKTDRKRKLRDKINELSNRMAFLTKTDYNAIHSRWINEMGGKPNHAATEAELTDKLEWLKNQISHLYQNRQNRNR